MNILVTGSKGFVGSYLIKSLKNYTVIPFDISNSPIQDIKHLDHLSSTKIDAIIHLAALCNIPESLNYPYAYFLNNVSGTLDLLEYARNHDVRKFLFASSVAHVNTPYGLTKHNGEEWCCLYHEQYDLETCILRIFNIYGSGQNKGVIHNFIEQIKQNEKLTVFGDGKQVRDYIHVSDVIKNIKLILNYKEAGIYEIGTGTKTTVNQLVEIFKKTLRRKLKVSYLPRRVGDVEYSFSRNPFAMCMPLPLGLKIVLEKESLL